MFDDFRVTVAEVGEAVLDLARAVKDLAGYLEQSGRAVGMPLRCGCYSRCKSVCP